MRVGSDETSNRDPRQRLGLIDDILRPKTAPVVTDPRHRVHLLPQSVPPVLPTPSTPRYDEDHRTPHFRSLDSDMRQFPPPTPRIDDDYIPNTSRTSDPRQRNSAIDADPRRSTYQTSRNYIVDTDLRPQLYQSITDLTGIQQSQYNIK